MKNSVKAAEAAAAAAGDLAAAREFARITGQWPAGRGWDSTESFKCFVEYEDDRRIGCGRTITTSELVEDRNGSWCCPHCGRAV